MPANDTDNDDVQSMDQLVHDFNTALDETAGSNSSSRSSASRRKVSHDSNNNQSLNNKQSQQSLIEFLTHGLRRTNINMNLKLFGCSRYRFIKQNLTLLPSCRCVDHNKKCRNNRGEFI